MSILAGNTILASDFPSTSPGSITAGSQAPSLNSSGQLDTSFLAWKGFIGSGTTTYDISTASGTQNIAHGLGVAPKLVRIIGFCFAGTFNNIVSTVYSGSSQSSAYIIDGNQANNNGFIFTHSNGGSQAGVITVTSTNIVITWTKNGSPTGTAYLLWEALA